MNTFFEATNIIKWGGVILVLLLIFAETGLLLGLILPGGETLIFISGLLVSTGTLKINILLFLMLLIITGFLGDCSGFYIGKKWGPKLYRKKDSWYYKRKYLTMAENYFNKHRKTAIVFGKFLPVIRPFMPALAGMTGVKLPAFLSFTIVSLLLYMSAFLLGGYFLGSGFPQLKNYIGWILPISVLILVLSMVLQIRKNKNPVS